jgi:hypothetical protein
MPLVIFANTRRSGRTPARFPVGIEEQCRKARFLYLKASLSEGLNLEVNQDREAVQSYLQTLGFSNALAESLNEVDRLYFGSSTAFDLKRATIYLADQAESRHLGFGFS